MKIIIGTDGSIFSQNAIEKCCGMFAEIKNLQIKIVSAFEGSIPLDAFSPAAQYSEEKNKTAQNRAEEIVFDAEKILRERLPTAEITTEIAMEFPERFIVEQAKEWKADLIIVGSHGRGFWGRVALGSISNAVIHNAPCSVLVVTPNDENR